MGWNESPIHSSYEDDPGHAEAIDKFVVALAERVDELQDLEARGDLARLADRVTDLAANDGRTGYPLLARGAEDVATAARERNVELAYKALVTLTELAQRVRRGHRGSL